MIYLVDGTPGTGKTSLVLSFVLDNKDGLFKDKEGSYRPIYSVNIEGLDPSKLAIVPITKEEFMAKPLNENFEDGSVIIVDEASEVYPARSMSSKVPDHVQGLNILRHHGLTLIIITQAPTMIDPFVRQLVGKHYHIERRRIGSALYEWNQVQTTFSKAAKSTAIVSVYKPDKRTFALYHSATQHIKFAKKKPFVLYLILPMLLAVIFSAYFGINKMKSQAVNNESDQIEFRENNNINEQQYNNIDDMNLTPELFIPTIDHLEESKPIYNQVRNIKMFPILVGCVKNDELQTCTCYSQQGSPLMLINVNQCLAYLENRPFNPYQNNQSSSTTL